MRDPDVDLLRERRGRPPLLLLVSDRAFLVSFLRVAFAECLAVPGWRLATCAGGAGAFSGALVLPVAACPPLLDDFAIC